MTTDSGRHHTVTGPAVTFDASLLRAWLQESTGGGDRAGALGIDESFGPAHGGVLNGLDCLLAALTDDREQTPWRLHHGVQYVGFFRTYDAEGSDGAIIIADLNNGLRLASLHHDHRDFASLDSFATVAAIEALSYLAVKANTIVGQYLSATRAQGEVTDRGVCIYGLSEQQYRDLEEAMGLVRHALGRYKAWSAPDGVHLGPQYNVDAAIGYARRTGLRYSETREIHYQADRTTEDPAAPQQPQP
jgi:hypothetical protein